VLTLYPDWNTRLLAQIALGRKSAFAWGTFDCALWVCDCIQAMTGTDPAANYRGTYSTEAEAMAKIGGDLANFAATTTAALGMKEFPPLMAQVGNIVLVDNATQPGQSTALGIVARDRGLFALCASPKGLVRIANRRWLRSWRIA
jgi:hypothetical protein